MQLDPALMATLIEMISRCSDEFDDGVHLQVIKTLLTAITSTYCEVHDANLLLSVRACFHIHLMSKTAAIKTAAKAALTQIVSIINQRMEISDTQFTSHDSSSSANDGSGASEHDGVVATDLSEPLDGDDSQLPGSDPGVSANPTDFPTIFHKDAYLMFRALCKLSMKGLTDESQVAYSDSIVLQNK